MCYTLCSSSSCSTDAVDVILCAVHADRHIIVDNDTDVLYIQTTRCNISCDEHP